MSLFNIVNATCGKCGTGKRVELAASVNADRRADLRQAILDGTFQTIKCDSCGAGIRLPAHLSYIDIDRRQWILVEDASRIEQWREVEAEGTELFNEAFGPDAPDMQRAIGEDLHPRVVFGWPALREKLVAAEAGLDDAVLELLKIAVLRNVPAPPLSGDTELRLVEAGESELIMRWIASATEESIADLPLERSLYADLAANPEPWSELKTALEAGMFVDMNRIVRA